MSRKITEPQFTLITFLMQTVVPDNVGSVLWKDRNSVLWKDRKAALYVLDLLRGRTVIVAGLRGKKASYEALLRRDSFDRAKWVVRRLGHKASVGYCRTRIRFNGPPVL